MTRAQRKNLSIKMKQVYAKKKAKELGNLYNDVATPAIEEAKAQQASYDQQRSGEFQYRRGLVTAMECILRELR